MNNLPISSANPKSISNQTRLKTGLGKNSIENPGAKSMAGSLSSGKVNKVSNSGTDLSQILTKPKEEKKSSDVNEYLKVISRLENKIKKNEIKKADIVVVWKSLNKRIQSLKDVQKKRLLKMDFLKQENIKNLKSFQEVLDKQFNNPLKQGQVFTFLKDPEFMAILLDEPEAAVTYSQPPLNKPAQKLV